jgi:ABC-type uncharacterized transport system involved in gliding motility auxiliary subunit
MQLSLKTEEHPDGGFCDMSELNNILKTRLFSIGGLVVVLIIIILVNVLFARVNFRLDVTENRVYSLSEGTQKILENISDNVSIKFFYSRSMDGFPPHLKAYAGRVLDFLSEYEYHSGRKIAIEVYDPKPDSEEEEWARQFGIQGIDLQGGEPLYLGLVALAADQEEVIAFLDPSQEGRLEYDLTRIITRVQSTKNQKIGLISLLPVFAGTPMGFNMPGRTTEPWHFITELENTYEVIRIEQDAEMIPDDLDLLVIVHPSDMNDNLEYAIDQYVLKGGNALIFVDPLATRDITAQYGVSSSSLPNLFKAWGIEFDQEKAVVDFDFPTGLRTQNHQVESNPSWLSLSGETFNKDEIITSQLNSMILPIVGAIKKAESADIEYEPLIQSSTNSSLVNTFQLRFGFEEIRKEFRPTPEKYDLAVKIHGNFKTAFPDGKPQTETDENQNDHTQTEKLDSAKSLKESTSKAVLIIVADTDLLWDDYYLSKQNFLGMHLVNFFNDNLDFFLNASEMLSGGKDLISIRSRGKIERPFTRVQMLERKAAAQWLEREQDLVGKAEETNQRLNELESLKDVSQQFVLSKEQEEEIQKFKEDRLRIDNELKLVRRHLRSEIESLGSRIKFINIFLMPLLVSIAGIGYALYKRKKSLEN